MNYLEKVDEQFLLNFVKENLKDVYDEKTITVNKYGYMSFEWVVSGILKNRDRTLDISFKNFEAVADGEPLNSKISKLWCVALYKKFGHKYMEDLEESKMDELNAKYKIEKRQIEKELKEIRVEVIKETIK